MDKSSLKLIFSPCGGMREAKVTSMTFILVRGGTSRDKFRHHISSANTSLNMS